MSPRPDDDARSELRDLVAKASKRRDDAHLRAETEFWQEIDRLQRRYHGAQQDVADTLEIQRNQVRRQTQRYRPDQTADTADS
ncbi:hypothetical protein ACWHAN_25970 [Streptomyces albidoflavus]